MRSIITGAAYFFVCLFACPLLLAQSTPPTFLFLLEGKGVPTGTVHVFNVNSSTGGIAEVPGSPFNAGLVPNHLVADPAGRFVFVTNEESQDISGFSVNPVTGALTAIPGSSFFVGAQPVTAAIDSTGRFLYVFALKTTNSATNELLYEYTIDPATGVLTLTASSPTKWESGQGVLISSITFNAAGNFAYLGQVAGGASGAATLICTVNFTTGALTNTGSLQPANHGSANSIALSPAGNFLYSINSTGNLADGFTIGSSGSTLSENSGSPYAVPNAPVSLFVHPSGNFLYIANENQGYQTTSQASQYTGSISGYSVSSVNGSLSQVPGSPFVAGINPVSVVVEPTGSFAYSASTKYTTGYSGFAQILGYSINASTGALTPFSSPAFSDTALSNGGQLVVAQGATSPNPVPMISSLNPPSTAATGVAFTMQVNGVNFVPGSTVYYGGQVRATTFVSSTQVNASILATDIENGGNVSVLVFDPLPGGGASSPVIFPITALVPVITSTSPTTVVAGPNAFGFFCEGSNFTTTSVIYFNGSSILTLYFGPNSIFGITPTGAVAHPGTVTVSVTTASSGVPGGGTSNTATISITPAAVPISVSNISPSSATAGGQGFTLTILGTGFVQGSQVTFNLQGVPTTFLSSTQLVATIPASAIAMAGNPYVIVTNPNGSVSTSVTFIVNNPTPATAAITPAALATGNNAITLSVTGASFAPNSVVLVNGGVRPTTYRNSSQVQATLLPGDVQQGATLNIAVSNPPPGGGTTAALTLTVYDYKLVATTPRQSVTAGSQASYNLTLSAVNGTFNQAVTLTASGLPAGTTGSFTPRSIPAGTSAANILFTVITTPRSTMSRERTSYGVPTLRKISMLFLLVLGPTCFWFFTRQGRLRRVVPVYLVLLLVAVMFGLTACTSMAEQPTTDPNNYLGPPLGTYPLVIAGSSGKVTISTEVTLTIM